MRRVMSFPCAGETLFATLDEAPGETGLLIVSGGNEIRMGAHRGMALLGQRIARELGLPVFRFDRRGVGDSTGDNRGFDHSADDIAAAAATFAAECPGMKRIFGFGNCDAATALALFHAAAGIDAIVLANPWVVEETDALPPQAAIRARYAERLRDPKQWLRLVTGGVDLAKLARGLFKLSRPQAPTSLATRTAEALNAARIPVTILLSQRDNTAAAFADAWQTPAFEAARARTIVDICPTASHSFAMPDDREWLFGWLKRSLEENLVISPPVRPE